MRNFELDRPGFLAPAEAERALNRFQEDMQDSAWTMDDVSTLDLLRYLDLGDLLGLFNRHRSSVKNAIPKDILTASQIVEQNGAHAIRKRVMHPVRPLETGDYSSLSTIAKQLPDQAPSLIWEPLIESISLIEDPASIADAAIPRFWMDEARTVNNLPVPEFEDTGFIGRGDERARLKTLILSDQKVITVVGAGGIGKTALAMRVCHDLLDDSPARFDNIVWVTLKTQFLTADGIKNIADAVDSQARLLEHIGSSVGVGNGTPSVVHWDSVTEHMARHNTLLVVDNLETLGAALVELASEIPQGSKLLLTSRVGLGQIERRFDLPDFSPRDSEVLMRVSGIAYGYPEIKQLGERELKRYCRRLHHNPLLIKWFVQAVGKGASPSDVLAHQDFNDALGFCFANVYRGLSATAVDIVNVLLASRRALSQTQIRELVGVDRISFDIALLELRQSNAVETYRHEDGSTLYQISALILDYLSRNHPPSDRIVKKTRETLRNWQQEQERSTTAQNVYRYSKWYVLVETADQRIAASSLREALQDVRQRNPDSAEKALNRALELTPDWSEVYRVRAHLLKLQQRPIYDVENAFEDAIRYGENDINRRDYAVYLMSIGEHERALEQVEAALHLGTGVETVLRSLRALALTRLGRIADAITDYEFVWSIRELNQSQYDRMLQGTQYADALRRHVEQLTVQGKDDEADQSFLSGIQVVEQTAGECGWDDRLANVAIRLLAEKVDDQNSSPYIACRLIDIAIKWDSIDEFVRACNLQKAREQFVRYARLAEVMPNSARTALSADYTIRFSGIVNRLLGNYGFIECPDLGPVHIRASSMARPGDWSSLQEGQAVEFNAIKQVRGFHAIRLETLVKDPI